MKSVEALLRLLRQGGTARVSRLFALMVLVGLTDGVGVLLLVPLLAMLQGTPGRANGTSGVALAALRAIGIVPSVGGVLLGFVVLMGLRSVILNARDQQGVQLEHHLVDRLRERSFRALMSAEWRWLVRRRESDHANQLLGEVTRVGAGLHFGVGLLATLAAIGAYLAAACALSWQMTAVAVASGGLVFSMSGGRRRSAVRMGESLGRANRALQGNVHESLGRHQAGQDPWAGAATCRATRRHGRRVARPAASFRDQQWPLACLDAVRRRRIAGHLSLRGHRRVAHTVAGVAHPGAGLRSPGADVPAGADVALPVAERIAGTGVHRAFAGRMPGRCRTTG